MMVSGLYSESERFSPYRLLFPSWPTAFLLPADSCFLHPTRRYILGWLTSRRLWVPALCGLPCFLTRYLGEHLKKEAPHDWLPWNAKHYLAIFGMRNTPFLQIGRTCTEKKVKLRTYVNADIIRRLASSPALLETFISSRCTTPRSCSSVGPLSSSFAGW